MAERQNKTYTVFAIDPAAEVAIDGGTEVGIVGPGDGAHPDWRTLREVGTSEARSRAEAVEKFLENGGGNVTQATSFWAEADFEPLNVQVETVTKVKVRRRTAAAA